MIQKLRSYSKIGPKTKLDFKTKMSFDSSCDFETTSDLGTSSELETPCDLGVRKYFPIPQIKENRMSENEEVPIIKDNPLEDLLLKEPELFNEYAEDLKGVNLRKIRTEILNNDDYLSRFKAVWPKTTNNARRSRCIKFLEQNPGMRTMDPEVLWQRIFYYHVDYGPKAKRRFPSNPNPIQTTRENLDE